jgi:3D (Asp-Asp-Asp) domain-containing protein
LKLALDMRAEVTVTMFGSLEVAVAGRRRVRASVQYVALIIAVAVPALIATTLHAEQRKGRGAAVLTVSVTAYCVEGQTDAGTQTRPGTAAADPRVLPIGTVVGVDGLRGGYNGRYTVLDTGRAVKGNELDIFIRDCKAAKAFGKQRARVRVVQAAGQPKPESPDG